MLVKGSQGFVRDVYVCIHSFCTLYCSCPSLGMIRVGVWHDDAIKCSYFPRYWPFVRGIHRSPVASPPQRPVTLTLMFSLICACTKLLLLPSRSLWRHCNNIGYTKIRMKNKSDKYKIFKNSVAVDIDIKSVGTNGIYGRYIDQHSGNRYKATDMIWALNAIGDAPRTFFLLTESSQNRAKIRALISNYTHKYECNVIRYPCPSLFEPPFKLWHKYTTHI